MGKSNQKGKGKESAFEQATSGTKPEAQKEQTLLGGVVAANVATFPKTFTEGMANAVIDGTLSLAAVSADVYGKMACSGALNVFGAQLLKRPDAPSKMLGELAVRKSFDLVSKLFLEDPSPEGVAKHVEEMIRGQKGDPAKILADTKFAASEAPAGSGVSVKDMKHAAEQGRPEENTPPVPDVPEFKPMLKVFKPGQFGANVQILGPFTSQEEAEQIRNILRTGNKLLKMAPMSKDNGVKCSFDDKLVITDYRNLHVVCDLCSDEAVGQWGFVGDKGKLMIEENNAEYNKYLNSTSSKPGLSEEEIAKIKDAYKKLCDMEKATNQQVVTIQTELKDAQSRLHGITTALTKYNEALAKNGTGDPKELQQLTKDNMEASNDLASILTRLSLAEETYKVSAREVAAFSEAHAEALAGELEDLNEADAKAARDSDDKFPSAEVPKELQQYVTTQDKFPHIGPKQLCPCKSGREAVNCCNANAYVNKKSGNKSRKKARELIHAWEYMAMKAKADSK